MRRHDCIPRAARRSLLGDENSWGARFATTRPAILQLVFVGLVFHLLDLATCLLMIDLYGPQVEVNPIARWLLAIGGPEALTAVKVALVLAGVAMLMHLASSGRTRLARNSLLLVIVLGLLGTISNTVLLRVPFTPF